MRRRRFLKTAMGSVSTVLTAPRMLGGLGLLNSLQASGSNFTDYKSLVMVFLNGGVDSLGLLVPTDSSQYSTYKNLRQHLAFDRSELLNLGSGDYASPECCQSMVNLYENKKLSWVSNVGPLRQPTTKSMIMANERAMPYFVGSHNSQQIMWQNGGSDPNAREGWGGRVLDLIDDGSTIVSPNISLNGNQLFTSTLDTPTFSINPDIIQNLARLDTAQPNQNLDLFYSLQSLETPSHLDREIALRNRKTLEGISALSSVMDTIDEPFVSYPSNDIRQGSELQSQLKMAARLIAAAPELGHFRQVIMVEMNGYDTHDNQDIILPQLLKSLFDNLEAFQNDLESRAVDHRVVTFSQSDFGRTPTINANGTDHGWGGHNFVMGSPVNGGQIVGEIPEFGLETSQMHFGLVIPAFSVEQYASNVSQWFGLSRSQITQVFPNLNRFDDVDFGLFSE